VDIQPSSFIMAFAVQHGHSIFFPAIREDERR
jgi:hypothetical protein